jgi:hypothetical protein
MQVIEESRKSACLNSLPGLLPVYQRQEDQMLPTDFDLYKMEYSQFQWMFTS